MKRWNSLTGIIQALVRAKTVEIEVVDRIKIIPRVQRIVTQVIERVAVELIGAALADDGGLAAHRESGVLVMTLYSLTPSTPIVVPMIDELLIPKKPII